MGSEVVYFNWDFQVITIKVVATHMIIHVVSLRLKPHPEKVVNQTPQTHLNHLLRR